MKKVLAIVAMASLALTACSKKGEDKGGGGTGAGGGGGTVEQAGVKLDEAKLKELGAIQVPGFTCQPSAMAMQDMVTVSCSSTAENAKGAKITNLITIASCSGMPCRKIDLADYQAHADGFKSMLPRVHLDNPNLVFEIEEIDLGNGKKGIFNYSLSFVEQDGSKMSSNGGNVVFTDMNNSITMMLGASGAWPNNLEELKASVTKDEFIAAAKATFAAFASAF